MTNCGPYEMTLFYTDGCHLCDHAETLLKQTSIEYQKVDIMSDQSLIDLYSCTIPVLKGNTDDNKSVLLNWPFSLVQLQNIKREKCHY